MSNEKAVACVDLPESNSRTKATMIDRLNHLFLIVPMGN